MKKTLIALGVLAALPSLAMSAEVSIYGKVDVGLSFINVDPGIDGVDSKSTFGMMSGQTAGSRVGMTGFEELGNGTKVGFILETGFDVDSGKLGQGERIFGRQALLYLDGSYGNIKFGKMGALTSGFPSTGLFGGNMSPFAVGLGEVPGHRYLYSTEDAWPMDNTITYASPSWAGWQVMLQYSMGTSTKDYPDGIETSPPWTVTWPLVFTLTTNKQSSTLSSTVPTSPPLGRSTRMASLMMVCASPLAFVMTLDS